MAEVTIRGPFDLDTLAGLNALQMLESMAKVEATMREIVAVFNRAAPAISAFNSLLTGAPPVEVQRWEDDGGAIP